MDRFLGRCLAALLSFILGRGECHAGHRLDPDQMIVHLLDAGDILGRDDESSAFAFVGNNASHGKEVLSWIKNGSDLAEAKRESAMSRLRGIVSVGVPAVGLTPL